MTEEKPTLDEAQERAARAATKEKRAGDAARAMREYEAEKLAVLANTARLRALRLAKEGEDALNKQRKRQAQEDR